MTARSVTTSKSRALARGWCAALAVTTPAALSHGLADGHTVSLLPFAIALLASAFVCVPLVGRRVSKRRMGAAVLLSQGFFHALFAIAGHGVAAPSHGQGTHLHHGAALDSAAIQAIAEQAQPVAQPSLAMLIGHITATLLTLAALWYAERVVRALGAAADAALRALITLCAPLRGIDAAPLLTVRAASAGWPTSRIPRIGGLRGPPVLL